MKIPESIKGQELTKNKYTKTTPRKWTNKETKLLTQLIKRGKTTKQIAQILDRSNTSVAIKRKRLNKEKGRGAYNKEHYQEKQEHNQKFLEYIQPRNILDVYAGNNKQYQKYKVTTNDTNKEYQTDYHMESQKFMMKMILDGNKYDFIDLDPFGSAYQCIDLAMKLIRTNTPQQRGGDYA